MDYEKLHRYTINKLQQIVNSGKITVEIARDICADFVPESEDERIRKEILDFCKNRAEKYSNDPKYKNISAWIAWLEKQGEQKQELLTKENALKNSLFVEQKSAWSEENDDDAWLNDIISKAECNLQLNKDEIDFLKSLKDRVQTQPRQEWSEEDERMISDIDNCIKNLPILYETIKINGEDKTTKQFVYCARNWLKSLRPQSQWKPSGEQIMAIDTAINVLGKGTLNGKQLIELYQDLKKLKGEEI